MPFTVIVPLDGSPFGEAALPVAGKLAQAAQAHVVLVNVFPPTTEPVRDEGGRIISYIDQEEAAQRQQALDYLETIGNGLKSSYGLRDVEADAHPGEPVAGIVQLATAHAGDLIVMATHGRTGVARVLLGSVAGTVLRRSDIPVTLVRPAALGSMLEGE